MPPMPPRRPRGVDTRVTTACYSSPDRSPSTCTSREPVFISFGAVPTPAWPRLILPLVLCYCKGGDDGGGLATPW